MSRFSSFNLVLLADRSVVLSRLHLAFDVEPLVSTERIFQTFDRPVLAR